MIELKNVTKNYAEGNPALTDINLQIDKGEFVFIVGGSGAGKSTLLKLLIAEDKPTSGSIRVADQALEAIKRRKIPEYRRKIGIVFQDFRLFAEKTVYENVAFALRVTGEQSASIRTKVMASLQMVELSDKVKCYPGELSGCEQQRVALARAIAGGPNVIFADEPCGNIDPVQSRDLIELFGRIQSRYQKTVVVLTHDTELAESFGHRIVRLQRGQIVEDRAAYMPGEMDDLALSHEEILPSEEAATAPVSDSTIEYDLPSLVAAGEIETHTEEEAMRAETQLFDLPVADESSEAAPASDSTIEYNLPSLVAVGETETYTEEEAMQSATQLFDLPVADESAEVTSAPDLPEETAEEAVAGEVETPADVADDVSDNENVERDVSQTIESPTQEPASDEVTLDEESASNEDVVLHEAISAVEVSADEDGSDEPSKEERE